jgi:hypothetical protein
VTTSFSRAQSFFSPAAAVAGGEDGGDAQPMELSREESAVMRAASATLLVGQSQLIETMMAAVGLVEKEKDAILNRAILQLSSHLARNRRKATKSADNLHNESVSAAIRRARKAVPPAERLGAGSKRAASPSAPRAGRASPVAPLDDDDDDDEGDRDNEDADGDSDDDARSVAMEQ